MSFLVLLISSVILLFSNACFANVNFGGFTSSGYAEAFFYPPHDEFDPNPMVPFTERPTARYGLDIYATLSHRKFLPNLFAFVDSFSLFGDTLPQTDYNYRATPIVMDLTYGAGYRLTPNAQVRITTSKHINLGNYKGERLLWSAISFRYQW